MAKKRKAAAPRSHAPRVSINNCNVHHESFKSTLEHLAAVKAVAEAACANAQAIRALAEHIAGPIDNSIAFKLEGDHSG